MVRLDWELSKVWWKKENKEERERVEEKQEEWGREGGKRGELGVKMTSYRFISLVS